MVLGGKLLLRVGSCEMTGGGPLVVCLLFCRKNQKKLTVIMEAYVC